MQGVFYLTKSRCELYNSFQELCNRKQNFIVHLCQVKQLTTKINLK